MAKSKKAAPKRKAAAKRTTTATSRSNPDSTLVLCLAWVFTLLSVVFAGLAYWRYA